MKNNTLKQIGFFEAFAAKVTRLTGSTPRPRKITK
jgi:hypothetical protein